MSTGNEKKVVFFGCPLDCDEKYDSIQEKTWGEWAAGQSDDPKDEVLSYISKEVAKDLWTELESIAVPAWLRPRPQGVDLSKLTAEHFVSYMDQEGCRAVADEVAQLVKNDVLPDIPCMVAVDHSLTGGAFKALAEYYGQENIALVVLDSHTDAIPMSALAQAIQYDMEVNPESVHDPNDPLLYNRTDSYNASSFIYHLLQEQIVSPQNLYLLGVSDFPEKKSLRIKDPRIENYVRTFTNLKNRGVKIVSKKECKMNPARLKSLFRGLKTEYVYVSIDMDIGAQSAVQGVRFRNWQGLQEKQIYKVIEALKTVFSRGVQLAGLDVTEFNPRRAGGIFSATKDETYRIAANIIQKVAFAE
jgi:arginase family enzyme